MPSDKFELKLNTPENKVETILNKWDKKLLLEGGKSIVEKILNEFRGKLPNGIIYPDTSARPLYYLFDPIFTKISQEKQLKKPTSFFMKTGRPDTFTSIFEDYEGRELLYDEVEKMLVEKMEDGDTVLESGKDYFLKKAEDTAVKRGVEADRAREIEKYNENLSGRGIISNLAVIDDFSNQGTTRKEIDYAFGYEVPYFSIFANKYGGKVDIGKAGVLIDIDIDDINTKNPATDYNNKLSYTMGDQKSGVGVIKKNDIENKYSVVDTNESRNKIAQLRKEMRNLGEEIAKSFETKQ